MSQSKDEFYISFVKKLNAKVRRTVYKYEICKLKIKIKI
jgi:hypothetical protein